MHPVVCTFGPITIYSYGLALAVAFLVSATLIVQEAKRQHLDHEKIFNLCFYIFIVGIIGARILYIAQNLSYYLRNPSEMIMLQHGGLSWFGGLLGGGIYGTWYLKKHGLALYKTLDLVAPYLALAHAIGRVGCFFNGCCYGKVSSFGIFSPLQDEILIPTQLYSSFLLVVIFLTLRMLQARPHRQGVIFFTYLLLYSSKRFFIEFLRGDSPHILGGLTVFQLFSIAGFFCALTMLVFIKPKKS